VAIAHSLLADHCVGGVSTVYRRLYDHLTAAGIEVVTISPNPCGWNPAHIVVPAEEPYARSRRVAAVLDDVAPDVAECSSWEFELLDYARRPLSDRCPVIVRSEFACAEMRADALVPGERELMLRADRIIAVSESAGRSMSATYGIGSYTVLHNGVDRDAFHQAPRAGLDRVAQALAPAVLDLDPAGEHRRPAGSEARDRTDRFLAARTPLILWVGKVTYMKGWPVLQELARQLVPGVRFLVLLGHSPTFYPVGLPAGDDVLVARDVAQADLADVYRACDWVLCTSRAEGFGLAVAEAVCCGVPALLPAHLDVFGEFLEPGRDALWYSTTDEVGRLLEGPPPRPVTSGIPSWKTCADETMRIYAEEVAGRRGAAGGLAGASGPGR
jgi:glycosyltransferase involved in cell wall biosynthesis